MHSILPFTNNNLTLSLYILTTIKILPLYSCQISLNHLIVWSKYLFDSFFFSFPFFALIHLVGLCVWVVNFGFEATFIVFYSLNLSFSHSSILFCLNRLKMEPLISLIIHVKPLPLGYCIMLLNGIHAHLVTDYSIIFINFSENLPITLRNAYARQNIRSRQAKKKRKQKQERKQQQKQKREKRGLHTTRAQHPYNIWLSTPMENTVFATKNRVLQFIKISQNKVKKQLWSDFERIKDVR